MYAIRSYYVILVAAIGLGILISSFQDYSFNGVIYESPLDSMEKDKESKLYIEEPYVPGLAYLVKKPNELRRKILDLKVFQNNSPGRKLQAYAQNLELMGSLHS